MGIISNIGSSISKGYNTVDKAVGGYLPGGVKPGQPSTPSTTTTPYQESNLAKTISPTTQPKTSISTPTPAATTPTTATKTVSRGGGGGGGSSSQPTDSLGQPISALPSEQTTTNKLQQVIAPPKTALTPSLPSYQYKQEGPAQKAITASKDYGFVRPYEAGLFESTKDALGVAAGGVGKIFTGDVSGGLYQLGGTFEPYRYAGVSYQRGGLLKPLKQSALTGLGLGGFAVGPESNVVTSTFYKPTKAEVGIQLAKETQGMSISSEEFGKEYGRRTKGLSTIGQDISTYAPVAIETGAMIFAPELATPIALKNIAMIGSQGRAADEYFGGAIKLPGGLVETGLNVALVTGTASLGARALAREMAYSQPLQENLGALSKEGFKLAEVRLEGEASDLSFIRGYREAGGLRQEVKVISPVLKKDETFFIPAGKGESLITGKVESGFKLGGFTEPKFFTGATEFAVGGKGVTLEVAGSEALATIGKGTFIKMQETSALVDFGKDMRVNVRKQMSSNLKKYGGEEYTSDLFSGFTKELGGDFLVTKSGKISSLEINPSKEFTISGGGIPKGDLVKGDMMTFYHGTTQKSASKIFEEGLKPAAVSGEYRGIAKAPELVSLTTEKEYAQSFANRAALKDLTKGIKSEPIVLEINYPKAKALESLKSQGGLGLYGEVKVPSVPKEYIKNPYETKFTDTSFSGLKIQREGLGVKTNLKDITVTKRISMPKFETTFDITSETKGGDLVSIKQFKTPRANTGFIQQSTIQQFKTELVPSLPKQQFTSTALKSSDLTKGFGLGTGGLKGIAETRTRTRDYAVFSPRLTSSSSFGSKEDFGFATGNIQGSFPRIKYSSGVSSAQAQQEQFKFKEDTTTSQTFKQANNFNFGGGFPGFSFPSGGFGGALSIPELGSGLGYAPRRAKKSKRIKTKIAPSFTAEVFNIRTGMPKSGKLGINPFQIRGLPKGSKSFNLGI